jgi:hypothetical protein
MKRNAAIIWCGAVLLCLPVIFTRYACCSDRTDLTPVVNYDQVPDKSSKSATKQAGNPAPKAPKAESPRRSVGEVECPGRPRVYFGVDV